MRCAGVGVLVLAELGQDPGLEERLDQREHALVLDPAPHPVHQGRVVDRVEARLDVRVQHPPVTVGAELVDLSDRVVCSPLRPEPVGDRHEVGLEDRFQHQLQRRLDDPVRHRDCAPICRDLSWKSVKALPGVPAVPRWESLLCCQSLPAWEALFSQLYPVSRLPPKRRRVTPSAAPRPSKLDP